MNENKSALQLRLFYSYSHRDAKYRSSMETALSWLKQNRLLADWSDLNITPGKSISASVRRAMDSSDIMVFLLSHDFIASTACVHEWNYTKELATRKLLIRIPIILTDCPWKDFLGSDDIKALPNDGRPVAGFPNKSTAWQQVYEGIKLTIAEIRSTFTPKTDFLEEIDTTDFLSNDRVKLSDIFVFPLLSSYLPQRTQGGQFKEQQITKRTDLLKKRHVIIHGSEVSGKTALARHLFLSLVRESSPVLYIDMERMSGTLMENILPDAYRNQFNGDYDQWKHLPDKTIVIDNLTPHPRLLAFVVAAKEYFDNVIVAVSSDAFNAFFMDDERLTGFAAMKIEPLSHPQQEKLIRNRLRLVSGEETFTDGQVDQVKRRVDSIIVSSRIVPRYPFFVLSILQTYEAYVPDMKITAYGHCYYVLIISNLVKSGIPHSDAAISTSLNFAEHLAFATHESSRENRPFDFEAFLSKYICDFIIDPSILNRLQLDDYGIISRHGKFRVSYMYYFFLGRFLSRNSKTHRDLIQNIIAESYLPSNYLTLLFIIHHTTEHEIIDDILRGVMGAFDSVAPAKLIRSETERFGEIVDGLSESILSNETVDAQRNREGEQRDVQEREYDANDTDDKYSGNNHPVNDCYRVFRNNAILGQVLKNKYGTFERSRVEYIVETIAEGGLRVVNILLKDEREIEYLARHLQREVPDCSLNEVKNILRYFSFIWTMYNVERIVAAVNHPEIRDTLSEVVARKNTPAYDVIEYFSRLDSAMDMTGSLKDKLGALLKKHDDRFVRGVLSVRTQHYLNTHRTRESVAQSVCTLLGIDYRSGR